MASIWRVVFSIEETSSPRMLTLPSLPSRRREASSLLTGVQLDSRLESTTSHQQLFLEEIKPRSLVPSACYPTPLLLLRLGPGLTTSLTLCMPRELLFTGMLERVWRRESSLKLVRIWLLLRRIMRRLALILLREAREKMTKNTRKIF